MRKILPIILVSATLSACSNQSQPDSEKPQPIAEAPCDSFEMEFFDDAGNPYIMKVPCDTTVTQ